MLTFFELLNQEMNWLNSYKLQVMKNSRNVNEQDYDIFSKEDASEETFKVNFDDKFGN